MISSPNHHHRFRPGGRVDPFTGMSVAELRERVVGLELANYRAELRAEFAIEELKASEARERFAALKLAELQKPA